MTKYKDAHYTLSINAWLMADTNKTTQEVCEILNIKPDGSLAIVLKADGYFGYAPQTVWEWLKVKSAGPQMASEIIKTPDDLGPTTPKDLYPTSDIRMVMVELGKLQAKIDALQDDNKTQKADFRLILYGIIGSFLHLAGFFTYGDNRLKDKFIDLNKSTAIIGTKLDDIMQRPSFAPQPRR